MSEDILIRPVLNGRSILMMWLNTRLIARNLQDFSLPKPCKLILAKFKKFTNIGEKKLTFDEEDQIFLDKFAQDFKGACVSFNMVRHQSDSRKMWESFFTELWKSRGFMEFEQKFAGRILIPHAKMEDGNMLSISDNLFFFEELCCFSSELKLAPSETQLISSLYDLSGLTQPEKDKLLRDDKKLKDIKHQKDKLAAKLTAAEAAIKAYQHDLSFVQEETKNEKAMFKKLLDFQHSKNAAFETQIAELEAQIAELKMELEAAKQELGKKGLDAIPICHICRDTTTVSSHIKLLACCGYPIHENCFEKMCMANSQHRPPCPQCREKREKQYQFTPLTRNHPLLRHETAKQMQHFTTSVCEADFLEGVIGEEKIEPISKKDRKLSIYDEIIQSASLKNQDKINVSLGGVVRSRLRL